MTDQPFREIQLSWKQLFFLFMASVVLAVVIFLLGVSVGRGVRGSLAASPTAAGDTAQTTDTAVPTPMPQATQTQPGDLTYHDRLQGQGAAKPAEPPPPVAEPSPTATPPSTAPAAAAKPADAPAATPAKPETAKPDPPSPAQGSWVVQVGAFGTKATADKVAASLQSKGYAAFVDTKGPERSQFRVRVGPFEARADADRSAARLQREEGFKPVVQR